MKGVTEGVKNTKGAQGDRADNIKIPRVKDNIKGVQGDRTDNIRILRV